MLTRPRSARQINNTRTTTGWRGDQGHKSAAQLSKEPTWRLCAQSSLQLRVAGSPDAGEANARDQAAETAGIDEVTRSLSTIANTWSSMSPRSRRKMITTSSARPRLEEDAQDTHNYHRRSARQSNEKQYGPVEVEGEERSARNAAHGTDGSASEHGSNGQGGAAASSAEKSAKPPTLAERWAGLKASREMTANHQITRRENEAWLADVNAELQLKRQERDALRSQYRARYGIGAEKMQIVPRRKSLEVARTPSAMPSGDRAPLEMLPLAAAPQHRDGYRASNGSLYNLDAASARPSRDF